MEPLRAGEPRQDVPVTESADPFTTGRPVVKSAKGQTMKNCKLCKYSKVCNDLPGICIIIPYLAIAVVVVSLVYLFLTQEIL